MIVIETTTPQNKQKTIYINGEEKSLYEEMCQKISEYKCKKEFIHQRCVKKDEQLTYTYMQRNKFVSPE